MKLSLRWIFDHLREGYQAAAAETIVGLFNQITAEIESYEQVTIDLTIYGLGMLLTTTSAHVTLTIPEWKTTATLPLRKDKSDFVGNCVGYLVVKDDQGIRWATVKDFGLGKEGLFPPVSITEEMLNGSWKKQVEADDIIFDVDNKSITHRPDMWGHRGFAREIAAFMNYQLSPSKNSLFEHEAIITKGTILPHAGQPYTITNCAEQQCSVFAGFYIKKCTSQPSNIFIALRLCRVGSRPINALVDLTNYLMLDWSQPTHAYDAEKIAQKHIVIRLAREKEQLTVLDGTKLTLQSADLVIADEEKALGLAGVMGGLDDSLTSDTRSLFLESAHFHPATIRKTAAYHKLRTDASSRFEKNLDPYQTIEAIQRFLFLARHYHIDLEYEGSISVIGTLPHVTTIHINHSFIEHTIGITMTVDDVSTLLKKLEFIVQATSHSSDTTYAIGIPTFRASKDITIKNDIVEEIARYYRFSKLPISLPKVDKRAHDLTPTMRLRQIKAFLAYGGHMMEQKNYTFFNENVINLLQWPLDNYLELTNPVATTEHKLITSLIPALLYNVMENYHDEDHLRFFEWGRIWLSHNDIVEEQVRLSGLFFHKRKQVDFYECKSLITHLYSMLGITTSWVPCSPQELPYWAHPHQTAKLCRGNTIIGYVGTIRPHLINLMGCLPESDAFIFDIDGRVLLESHNMPSTRYKPISKYQATTFDLSFLAPLHISTKELEEALSALDATIERVELIDFFEKAAWADKRSLTFRLSLSHPDRSLNKDEIESIRNKAILAVSDKGGSLRS